MRERLPNRFRTLVVPVFLTAALSSFTVACGEDEPGGGEGGAGGERSNDAAPDPTANRIETFKNTPASTTVDAGDSDSSEHEFAVSAAPGHGTAAINASGTLEYTPDTDFVGQDTLTVTVTDDSGESGEVQVAIEVTNRAPAPSAAEIVVGANNTGSTTIDPNDPDPGETATFELIATPEHGTATVNDAGQVSYRANPGMVSDSVTVEVTDGSGDSGTVDIAVTRELVSYSGLPGAWDDALCASSNEDRLSVVAIDPPLGTVLDPATEYDFTVTLWYQSQGGNIGASLGDPVVATTVVDPDDECGTVDVTVTTTTGASGTELPVTLQGPSNWSALYAVNTSAADVPTLELDTIWPPAGTLIEGPFFEAYGSMSWTHPDYGTYDETELAIYDTSSDSADYNHYAYPLEDASDVPFRFLTSLKCDDTETGYVVTLDYEASRTVTYPAVPPVIQVNTPLVGLAIDDEDATFDIDLTSCVGDTTATLVASADWFEVPENTAVLAAGSTITVTIHGGDLEPGRPYRGNITVTPSGADAFDIPVEITRLELEGTFTQALDDTDDSSAVINLPFDVPAEGGTFDQLIVNSNGLALLQDSTGTACTNPTDYEHPLGPWPNDPAQYGCPVFAVGWGDHRLDYATEAFAPGIYQRTGPNDAFVEVVWWNLSMYPGANDEIHAIRVPSTRIFRIYADGRTEMDFPLWNPGGLEVVGWMHSDGTGGEFVTGFEITKGQSLSYDPLPAP